MATNQTEQRVSSEERRMSAAYVRLNLFRIGDDIYAHWTPEDREILKDEGANSMVWMDELAVHEARHG